MAGKSRSRVLVFRLTEEEYVSLKTACAAARGRSLSDYARSELRLGAHGETSEMIVWQTLRELDQKLIPIEQLVRQLFSFTAPETAREASNLLCIEKKNA